MRTSIQGNFQTAACVTLLLVSWASAPAQGPFQNLDFEAARNVPATPGTYMSAADALPYWTLYIGTNQQSQALYNGVTLDAAEVGIWDNAADLGYFPPPGFVSGQYCVSLQGGRYGDPQNSFWSASIAQSGEVPAGMRSIQFVAIASLTVTFDGADIPLVVLQAGSGYNLYGGDITQFAGQTGELEITSNTHFDAVDSIVFSPEPVPEPGTLSLGVLGALVLGRRALNLRRQSPTANKPVQAAAGQGLCLRLSR